MEWFCLLLVVLLVAGTIIVVLFSRINSLENRIQTQEARTFAHEKLPPVDSLPEIPEELKPPVLETGEPVVSKPLHYPTDPAPSAAEPAAERDPRHRRAEPQRAGCGPPADRRLLGLPSRRARGAGSGDRNARHGASGPDRQLGGAGQSGEGVRPVLAGGGGERAGAGR